MNAAPQPMFEGLSLDESENVSPMDSPEPETERTSRSRSPQPGHSNESTPDDFVQALRAQVSQQRPRSPYSRTHIRSHSAQTPSSQPMARARSLPMYESRARGSPAHSPVRPSSPLRPPPAARASPRRSFEEQRPSSLALPFMEDIVEDSELDIQPRPAPTLDPSMNSSFPQAPHTLPRSNSGRRRPASPLHALSTAYAPPPSPLTSSATTSAPATLNRSPSSTPPPSNAARFNETYPRSAPQPTLSSAASMTSIYSSASSVPSTPTSFRSRSPSISSLETIPDSPDAEAEAQSVAAREAAQIAQLKVDADEEESDEERRVGRRRSGGLGDAAKRKRWSVCGGERRDAFEMETIWED